MLIQVIFQQTSPTYSPVCPGDDLVLTCTVTGTLLQWINPVDNTNSVTYSVTSTPGTTGTVGNLIVVFVSSVSNVIKSEARLYDISSHHNGSSIICNNVIMVISNQIEVVVSGKYLNNYTITQYNLKTLYIGTPSSPQNVTFSPLNSSSLILHWSVPLESGHCIVNYSVKVNNTWQQLVTTNTSVVITGLSFGSIYEIIVTGIDSEGRQGINSDLLSITWDGK